MKCEKCNTIMEEYKDAGSQGIKCPNCGWAILTTREYPISQDNKTYSIILNDDFDIDKTLLSAVSKIIDKNFFDTKLFLTKNKNIYSGSIIDVLNKSKILNEKNISYKITPPVPYGKDEIDMFVK